MTTRSASSGQAPAPPDRAALMDAGRAYLERWSVWLRQNPDADPAMVEAAMQRGDPPPDDQSGPDLEKRAQEKRLDEIRESTSVISGLTKMQREWLVRYLLHGNASLAAEEVGYSHAYKQGPRLRQNPKIREAIDEYFFQQEMGAKEVVARLSQQARAEYANYIDAYGRVDLAGMKRDGRMHLVKGVKQTAFGLAVDFYDAHSALVQVGRYHSLFGDKLDANVATNDSGMTVDEWKAAVEKRRQEAAETLAQFEDDDDAGDDYDDTADPAPEGETP